MESYNTLHDNAYNNIEDAISAIEDMVFLLDVNIKESELDEGEIAHAKNQRKLLRSSLTKLKNVCALFAENTIETEED